MRTLGPRQVYRDELWFAAIGIGLALVAFYLGGLAMMAWAAVGWLAARLIARTVAHANERRLRIDIQYGLPPDYGLGHYVTPKGVRESLASVSHPR